MEITQFSLLYRPLKWKDVYGQDTTVKALKERLKKNEIPSCMLFQGPYGTGKTTLAQLFAACLVSPTLDEDMNPDWNSPACKAILSGSFDRDVQRLDGGQLSGKSDVIDFLKDINLKPFYDKRRVLLIEESDAISNAGMSSLLKIMEGLKPWTTIILLSMEDKVPGAIKSRCQLYKVKPVGVKDIMYNLKHVLEQAGKWDDPNIPQSFKIEGLGCIATTAQGSMRVAVQYLEQCLAAEAWSPEQIDELLGVVDEEKTWRILDGLLKKTKDDSIWQTILRLKTGEETNHAFNYLSMILCEALLYKETGRMYDESLKWRFDQIVASPYLEDLFYCLTLHPQMNKPYLRTSDLIGCLMCYYQGLNFKPGVSIKSETAEPKLTIGSQETPAIFTKTREPVEEEIPTRGSKTNIADIDIVF